jgi:hypothetical protein
LPLIGLFLFFACKEPFIYPASQKATTNYLVVDGFIQIGDGSARIYLSRTHALDDSLPHIPENGATVSLSGSNSGFFSFYAAAGGVYQCDNLPADYSQTYQLNIRTFDGKEYISDTVTPIQSPEIDSIHWELNPPGIQISVTTHDAPGNSPYYRWTYAGTWEHRAKFESLLIYQNGGLQVRGSDQQIYKCWKTDTTTDLLISSSAKLKQDLIYEQPIKFIDQGADELSQLYTIIVYQNKLSRQAYEYWDNLKKNTELRGSLFDPQPSQVSGNMRCITDPNEPVIGFVSMGTITSKRIFISNAELAYWYFVYPYECGLPVDLNPSEAARLFGSGFYVPLSQGTAGISATGEECGDCRYTGGSTTKPGFFP